MRFRSLTQSRRTDVQLKPGVRILGIKSEILLGAAIANDLWKVSHPDIPFVVTACVDGTHKSGSLHYAGQAIDIRTHGLTQEQMNDFVIALRQSAGADFDVIVEFAGTPDEHVHMEFDPKTGVNQ